jgi:hypothetical protein
MEIVSFIQKCEQKILQMSDGTNRALLLDLTVSYKS